MSEGRSAPDAYGVNTGTAASNLVAEAAFQWDQVQAHARALGLTAEQLTEVVQTVNEAFGDELTAFRLEQVRHRLTAYAMGLIWKPGPEAPR